MKQLYLTFLILTAILSAPFRATAYDFEVDGMYFNIVSLTEKTCELTQGEVKYSGDVIIPDSVTFNNRILKVIRIKNGAFLECDNLYTVIIPNSVTEIGDLAFEFCTHLSKTTIPNSVTKIGSHAFSECRSLSTVSIPNSVTSIGYSAFSGCISLTATTLPNSITKIDDNLFYKCSSLIAITIPRSVTNIGYQAFLGCSSLTEISIPNSVTSIEDYAFSGCTNLTTLIIESSIEPLTFFRGTGYNSFLHTQIINLTIGRDLILSRDSNFNLLSVGLNKISNLTILDNIGKIDFLFSDKDFLPETLSELTIGENNTDYPSNLSSYKSLKTITLKDRTPQRCPEFTNLQFENIKVYVPEGALSSYQNADGWKNFWHLSDSDESGINEIISDAIKTEVARYDLQGRQVSADYRGLIIVCYSDGSVEKVINQ